MWVTAVSSGRSSQSVQVGEGRRVLGRAPTCDVVIEDPHVSQQHAQLDVTPEGTWLADLQSTNGTFVAGNRLERREWLAVPSEFCVGETTVRLTVDEPTVLLGAPPAAASTYAPDAPPAPPASQDIGGAGPVAGGDVAIRGGRDAAGRDLIIHEGFKLRTKMRSSAKNCIRLGCLVFLVGFALFGYFVIRWNNEIFDAVTDPNAQPPSDLPSPLPWLPLGAGLSFVGLVLVVVGLLIPRDRIVTRNDG
jgi:Inner membrane component of T3SS, cytoplasmic domain